MTRHEDMSCIFCYHRNMRHGFLLIDKPTGPTSHDTVSMVRRVLSEKHIGHLGTLDPLASGLLVLAVGSKALKVIEMFKDLSKEYIAEIHFGATSTTYDADGMIEEVTMKVGVPVPDTHSIMKVISDKFAGSIEQTPPAHSAIHINGQRAYDLARKGLQPNMTVRQVMIDECEILSFDYPKLTVRVACSSGTYIRSLAHDLGQMLRCGAYLSALRRTKVGEWDVQNSVAPDKANWANVLPLKDLLTEKEGIEINQQEAEDIRHGRTINREVKPDTFAWFEGLPIAIMVPAKEGGRGARPRKVL